MLSHRAAFSLFAAALLALSLGIKASMPNNAAVPDVGRHDRELAALLTAQGFSVGTEHRDFNGDLVVATRGTCRLKTRTQDALLSRAAIESFASGLPVLKYRYRGNFSDSFPRGSFELRNKLQWLGLRYGLLRAVERPLLIVANNGCDLSGIDFGPQLLFLKGS